jgi:1-acyl-sn-glycerol-3-phosphate acyltransferase
MASLGDSLHFVYRLLLATLWMYLCIFYGIYLLLRYPRDSNFGHRLGPFYAWGAFKLGGMRLVMENKEIISQQAPNIFIANHQSFFDVAICCAVAPEKSVVTIKKSFLYIPFLGLIWWWSNQIFLERFDRDKARQAMSEATRRVQQDKVQIWMMPEGTRNTNAHKLMPFKRGAFHVAIDAQVPIVPIVIAPLDYCVDRTNWVWKGGDVHCKVLDPIPTVGLKSEDAGPLADRLQLLMQTELDAMVRKYYSGQKNE